MDSSFSGLLEFGLFFYIEIHWKIVLWLFAVVAFC